ncbi:MAG: hypothetical protein IT580_01840 [Verrucomicrobiales bacterium]|nr:hypothetical protein [Verrucomicrobiales bacterium]
MTPVDKNSPFGLLLPAFVAITAGCLSGPMQAQTTWNTNGANIWYAPSTVNVGIGTAAPGARLDVDGSVQVGDRGDLCCAQLRMRSGYTVWDLYSYASYAGGGFSIFGMSTHTGGPGAGNVFTIVDTGNVGIGTMNPGPYKLAVDGTIGARDIFVTSLPWSDYVLRPGYRLRPLSEVHDYIQAHHHLPDIPSEAEVKEKGVSVGEMQSKLLAKIEELTLHMIQAEQQNRDLRERLARLEVQAER